MLLYPFKNHHVYINPLKTNPPSHPRHDPDIQHLPALAVTPEIFKKPPLGRGNPREIRWIHRKISIKMEIER